MLYYMIQKRKVYSRIHAQLFWLMSFVSLIVAATIWIIQPAK